MNELKIICIGGFGHALSVFDDMIGMSEVELVGIAPAFNGEDISFFVGHRLCNGLKQYSDYHEMLDKTKPDVAIISTRLDIIPKMIIDAAKAGCHIITEKPLALSKDKLREVYKAVKDSGVRLTAMLSMRSEPVFIAARQVYQSGAIGQAVLVNGRKSYKYGNRPEWFGDKEKYGGTIGWVGIHAFDFINFVTGLVFSKIAAMQGNFNHPQHPACQDNCTFTAELNNGGHCTISVDFFRPESAEAHGDDWIRVVGTKGIIEARDSDNTCKVLVDSEAPVSIELPPRSNIFKNFLLSLNGDENIETFQRESFMLTEVCLCANDSALRGTVVNFQSKY